MNNKEPLISTRLWRKDFWLMNVANLFISMSLYMLLPVWPSWLVKRGLFENYLQAGFVIALFCVGLYLLGPFCNYWLDRYRRKNICLWAALISLTAALIACFPLQSSFLILIRIIQGAAFSVFQITVGSTLLIDLTCTKRRTEAAHIYYWFGRFALSLGPVGGLLAYKLLGIQYMMWLSVILAGVAFFILLSLHVPFRAPLNPSRCSLDRFWLPRDKWLFLNLFPISFCVGLAIACNLSFVFYGLIMVGFLLAIISRLFIFSCSDQRKEIVAGFLFIGIAFLMHLTRNLYLIENISSLFLGWGVGLTGSRFLLFFIKSSEHCERGTAQTTYFLAWETGLCLGIFLGCILLHHNVYIIHFLGICLMALSLLYYLLFTHKWFISHCRR